IGGNARRGTSLGSRFDGSVHRHLAPLASAIPQPPNVLPPPLLTTENQAAKRGPVMTIFRRGSTLIFLGFALSARGGSYYTQRLEDPKAVYVTSPGSDKATTLLQEAINRIQETTGQGIVFLAEGRYQITNTLFVWPGVRLIGYAAARPIIVLPINTPG